MKKLKVLLSAVLTCVFAVALFALVGCGGTSYELQSIQVDATEAKTEYTIGEQFTSEGLKVTANRLNTDDGSEETVDVPLSDVSIDSSAFNSSAAGEYTITVSYTLDEITESDSYTVTVAVATQTTLVNISLNTDAAKTSFFVGEEYSSEGLAVSARLRQVTGGSVSVNTVDVAISDVVVDSSEYNASQVGEYEIVVSYTAYGSTQEATYTVTVVNEVRINSIFVDYENAKLDYNIGDAFTAENIVITITEYNFKTNEVADTYEVAYNAQGVTIDSSEFDSSEIGVYDIVVSYEKEGVTISTTYSVNVMETGGLVLEISNSAFEAVYTDDGISLDHYEVALAQGGTVLNLSDIVVYFADSVDGQSEQPLENCSITVYNGQNVCQVTNGTVTLQAGTYNVWATYGDYVVPSTGETYPLSAFIVIVVE